MSLYLCVFAGEEDAAGLEIGSYSDFNALRDYIGRELEAGKPGSRYPTLMLHSDCDGDWPVLECGLLAAEIRLLIAEMKARPAVAFPSEWQEALASSLAHPPRNALESFIDVDGECLVERLGELVEVALTLQQPILFQ